MEMASTSPLAREYVELRSRSAFSFLEGASSPESLALNAASLGHSILALGDRGGVYGIPRFHKAAQKIGLRAIVGAEIELDLPETAHLPRLRFLVESAEGWRRLSRLLTLGHQGRSKDECRIGWNELEEHAQGLTVLLQGDERLTPKILDRVRGLIGPDPERLWVDVSRHLDRRLQQNTRYAIDLAETYRIPIIATGDVRCALPKERQLLDALVCLRDKTTLDGAGRRLLSNGEHHLKAPEAMAHRFKDQPEWIRATRTVAERCAFDLDDLDYRFPEYPIPNDESQNAHLRSLTFRGATERYGTPLPGPVKKQLEHELRMISRLDLAGYFLIVNDIADFARRERILCQGRGSAANSAVCYSLGITAVDPVGMKLLFERFLSEERGEWPDIDLDLPSGDQRERVIQYVFQKYGEQGAAMTANVITYRTKMAVREMGKVLGLNQGLLDRLSKQLSGLDQDDSAEDIEKRLHEVGIDSKAPRISHLLELTQSIQGLPRHLGQHSGGIVIAAGRLDEVVPIEPAQMAGRRVVQWDKEDCADRGIIKIDLLGLGMLAALEETIPLIRAHEGIDVDLAHLPKDDPDTYRMIQKADTVGVFQIESRAQMATLPRMKPRTFYDLVVEIAIIRPGPIVGKMVHPYLNRRAGREPITYPHPCLEPILERTLGVPIFQEQLLRIAMTAAGFSGGEAEELRRAMGFKRSNERMKSLEIRLKEGMQKKGLSLEAQDDIIRQITSFALYGFPESHSASFALIAYASSYLKCHHPAAFLVGLLNAWPMGFYNPATLVKDAQRHGVEVRPIDVTRSDWRCTLENDSSSSAPPSVRIGLRFASGLHQSTGHWIESERAESSFQNLADLVRRVPLQENELQTLAELGAMASLDGSPKSRRAAVWQVSGIERDRHSLFAGHMPRNESAPILSPLSDLEQTLADYRLAGLTTGPQIMKHVRPNLKKRGFKTAAELSHLPDRQAVQIAGHVIVRQRPSSAGGFVFLTLEDETGLANVVLTPKQVERFRIPLHSARLLEVAGPLQHAEGVIHLRLRDLAPLDLNASLPSERSYR